MITGYTTYRNINETLNTKLDYDTKSILNQKLKALTFFEYDLQRMGSSLALSPVVSDFLKNTSMDAYPSFFKKLDGLVESIHAIRPENVGITIVSDAGFIYNFGYTLNTIETSINKFEGIPKSDVYSEKGIYTTLHTRPYVATKDKKPVFSFVRQIISNNLKAKGFLIIDFPIDVLDQLFDHIHSDIPLPEEENSGIFVSDQNGLILYPYSNQFFINKDLKANHNNSRILKNNKYYKLIQKEDLTTGWTINAYFLEDTLYAPVYRIRNFTITITIITMFICLFASYIFSRKISNPLQKLKKLMKQFGSGDFNLYFDIQRNDEIGALAIGFNQMVNRIKELIHLAYQEQNEKRRAEVAALQSQINPHFLYNTLEWINALARKNKEMEISKMTVMLGRLLRLSISTFEDVVPIKNELEYVRYYLEIHKFRLQKPIHYEIAMDEEIPHLYTVKWILQPIIENAIIHGLDPKQHGGNIKITGWMDKDDVYIQITDQGVGVSKEQLEFMRYQLQHHAEELSKYQRKVGLYNVHSRIRLHFGEEYGLHLDSILNEGMTVTIKLPRRLSS